MAFENPIPTAVLDASNLHAERLELALQYQLVTDQTNLLLVHVRMDGQKAVGLPQLEQIAPMRAAGWGGAGSVMAADRSKQSLIPVFSSRQSGAFDVSPRDANIDAFASRELQAVRGRNVSEWTLMAEPSLDAFDRVYETPAFLRKDDQPAVQVGSRSPVALLHTIEASALSIEGPLVWPAELAALGVPQALASLVETMVLELGSREQAWGIVLHWLGQALASEFTLSRQAARIVRSSIKAVDAATLLRWTDALALALGPVQAGAWGRADQTA